MDAPILLASASPRRRALLRLLNLPYGVCSTDIDEAPHPGENASDMVARLSRAKAQAGRYAHPEALVIACDTTVELDRRIFGKPSDAEEARQMLRELRGREHRVYGGITLCYPQSFQPGARGAAHQASGGEEETIIVCTRVRMRQYSDPDMEAYVASGDPLDKAAAYAVQHPLFHPVELVEGCFANVMGLALCRLYEALARRGSVPTPSIECFRHPEQDCTVARLVAEGRVEGA